MMPYLAFTLTLILIASHVSAIARAESEDDKAFSKVLANVAHEGYEAANSNYTAGVVLIDDVLLWSRRRLDAENGISEIGMRGASAIKSHLERIEQLRRRANVEDALQAAKVDFDYQQAKALLAREDASKAQWSDAIIDLSRMQGTWKEDLKQRRGLGRHPDNLRLTIVGGVAKFHQCGFVTLDPQKNPKAIDIAGLNSDYVVRIAAIYDLKGDRLRLSWVDKIGTNIRPSGFANNLVPDQVIYTLQRQASKSAAKDE